MSGPRLALQTGPGLVGGGSHAHRVSAHHVIRSTDECRHRRDGNWAAEWWKAARGLSFLTAGWAGSSGWAMPTPVGW